jgi:hypothetical protein
MQNIPFSFIRTMTVGPGITPGLLTLPFGKRSRARGNIEQAISRHYRRWGIAPRPENVAVLMTATEYIMQGKTMFETDDLQKIPGLRPRQESA